MQPYFELMAEQIDFFEGFFGPFPFDRYGLAFADSVGGLAMEILGRSMFSRSDFDGDEAAPPRCSSPTSWPTSGSATP